MQFCQDHWDKMRDAIEARGMTALVSPDGQSALEKTIEELQRGEETLDTFDPLMSMHWTIAGNVMELLGQSAGYLLSCPEGEEDPIDVSQIDDVALKAKYLGKKWPICPICYINIAHEISCREERCHLAQVDGYDACIEWSADGVKARFDELMAATK